MVKQGKEWAVAATPALGQMRTKWRENFSPQESRQDCVPQKSLCLWRNLTRKVSPRTIVTRGGAVLSGLDKVDRALYVQGKTKWRKSGLQRHRPESLGAIHFLPYPAPPSGAVLSSPRLDGKGFSQLLQRNLSLSRRMRSAGAVLESAVRTAPEQDRDVVAGFAGRLREP